MRQLIDFNSHYFVSLTESLDNYRRLLAAPELKRLVISTVNLKLDYSARFPFMSIFSTTNEDLARLVEKLDSSKIIPWCFSDPLDPDAPAQLEYWITQRGMRGVKLYPPRGFAPSDPRALEVCRTAERLCVPVFFHMGRTACHPQLNSRFGQPVDLEAGGLACPDLKVIIGHAAGPWYMEAAQIAMGFPNFYFDLSTAGTWDLPFLKWFADHEYLGAQRLLLGTNNNGQRNLQAAQETLARLELAGFSEAQIQAAAHDNAQALLDSLIPNNAISS